MNCLSFMLAVAAAVILPVAGVDAADARLEFLKWKARPVVVLSDSRDDPRVSRQIAALESAKAGASERDIKVLNETEPNGRLRRQLGLRDAGFAVVLVGKDGGVKKIWREPVDPKRIFAIIDQMPMRREEMKG